MPVASAQVKTSLLLAGLFAEGETRVEEPVRTRDHGELALRAFGAEVQHAAKSKRGFPVGRQLALDRGQHSRRPLERGIFSLRGRLVSGFAAGHPALSMNPTRSRLLDVLIGMGLGISVTQIGGAAWRTAGTVQVEGRSLRGATIAGARYGGAH